MLTQPKLLPCGHTFCHRCLEKFVNPKLLVECPICRKVASNTSWFWKVFDDLKVRPKETQLSVLGVASLPDNIALRREVSFSLFGHLNFFLNLQPARKLQNYSSSTLSSRRRLMEWTLVKEKKEVLGWWRWTSTCWTRPSWTRTSWTRTRLLTSMSSSRWALPGWEGIDFGIGMQVVLRRWPKGDQDDWLEVGVSFPSSPSSSSSL